MKLVKKITLVVCIISLIMLFTGCNIKISNGNTTANGSNSSTVTTKNSDYSIVTKTVSGTTSTSLVETIANLRSSVVEIYCSLSSGTSAGAGVVYGYMMKGDDEYVYSDDMEESEDFVGYTIVTCFHVIEDGYTVLVKDIDGNKFYADVLGGDPWSDIAVLSIDLTDEDNLDENGEIVDANLSVAAVRSLSDEEEKDYVKVGEEVVAIGNPLGTLGGTVTKGIISSTDREITVSDKTMTLIQTDCAINSGNSGGGLFSISDGSLVGIVNAGYSGDVEGLNFAIPGYNVKSKADELIEKGYVEGRTLFAVTEPNNTSFFGLDSASNYVDYDMVLNTQYSRVGSSSIGAYIYYINTDRDNIKTNSDLCSLNYNSNTYYYLTGITYGEDSITDIKSAEDAIEFLDGLELKAGEKLTLTIKAGSSSNDYSITLQQYKYEVPKENKVLRN